MFRGECRPAGVSWPRALELEGEDWLAGLECGLEAFVSASCNDCRRHPVGREFADEAWVHCLGDVLAVAEAALFEGHTVRLCEDVQVGRVSASEARAASLGVSR